MPRDLIPEIQAHVARVTLGPSALRRQGPGVAEKARPFFAALPLSRFATASSQAFARRLDEQTEALRGRFPQGSGSWGLARKLLNIFLREALYNKYLEERFRLSVSEPLFEVPLDSITGTQLAKKLGGTKLPSWPGVKHLRPEVSAQYQSKALEHAAELGICRVHLDAIWWGGARDAA
jgi:hypothetical protein